MRKSTYRTAMYCTVLFFCGVSNETCDDYKLYTNNPLHTYFIVFRELFHFLCVVNKEKSTKNKNAKLFMRHFFFRNSEQQEKFKTKNGRTQNMKGSKGDIISECNTEWRRASTVFLKTT